MRRAWADVEEVVTAQYGATIDNIVDEAGLRDTQWRLASSPPRSRFDAEVLPRASDAVREHPCTDRQRLWLLP